MLAYLQLSVGWIVEDVAGDLVADALAREEGLAGDARQDLVQAAGKARAEVKAVKITSLDKPSAMAFGPDGALYVTVFGTAKEGSKKKPGSLVKIIGKL